MTTRRLMLVGCIGTLIGLGSIGRAPAEPHDALELIYGSSVSITPPLAKPLYLKFWATWCPQCRRQMPHLEALYNDHHDEIDIVAVNIGYQDSREKIARYRATLDLTLPMAIEPSGWLADKFGVPRVEGVGIPFVPYSVIIDREGVIAHQGIGDEGVDSAIARLVAKNP